MLNFFDICCACYAKGAVTLDYSWHHKSAYTYLHFCGHEHCTSQTDIWASVTIPSGIAHLTLQPQLFRFPQILARFIFPARHGISCCMEELIKATPRSLGHLGPKTCQNHEGLECKMVLHWCKGPIKNSQSFFSAHEVFFEEFVCFGLQSFVMHRIKPWKGQGTEHYWDSHSSHQATQGIPSGFGAQSCESPAPSGWHKTSASGLCLQWWQQRTRSGTEQELSEFPW